VSTSKGSNTNNEQIQFYAEGSISHPTRKRRWEGQKGKTGKFFFGTITKSRYPGKAHSNKGFSFLCFLKGWVFWGRGGVGVASV